MESKHRSPKLVLIDDDPSYTVIMRRVAEMEGITLDTYQSLSELGFIGMLGKYDLAIIDYDLGKMTGVEIGNYLEKLFEGTPMILVSELERENTGWPSSVKKFLLKSDGYKHVLEEAINLLKQKSKNEIVDGSRLEANSKKQIQSIEELLEQ